MIDTSALFAILAVEPEANELKAAVSRYSRAVMSAPTWVEAAMVCGSRLTNGRRRFDDTVRLLGIERSAFDGAQADLAAEAFVRYGRGSGHSARLNFGDCFSYALARVLDAPLLYKGDDFVHTDVRSALPSPP